MTNDIQLKVNNQLITGGDILSAVDAALAYVKETGDVQVAQTALTSLKGIEKVTGRAIARLLYGLQEWWDESDQEELTGDTFEDWLFSIDTEFNNTYIKRCLMIQKYESNGTFSERIIEHPIKEKQAIASHLEQGFPLNKAQWKKLERADSEYEVGEILRDAKGKAPRKHTLSITLERNGTLTVWYQGEAFFGGHFELPKDADTELQAEALEKMIHRLTKNTGVKVQ